jgi:hypothetical protein
MLLLGILGCHIINLSVSLLHCWWCYWYIILLVVLVIWHVVSVATNVSCCWCVVFLILLLVRHVVGASALCCWRCYWCVVLHYVNDVLVGLLYYLCYCWFVTLLVLLIPFPFYIFIVVLSCLVPTPIACVSVKYYPHCHASGTLVVYHVIVCLLNTKVQLICYVVSVVIKVHCVLHVPW